MAAYRDARDLIEIGAYVKGTNPLVDRAVQLRAAIDHFLRQDVVHRRPHIPEPVRPGHVGGAMKRY